jgi:multiple sugar transport system substrate-binding protein/sn-glycerol 3-phosphate transport system substrate-binding protein
MSKKTLMLLTSLFLLLAMVLGACSPAAEPTEEMAEPTEEMAEPTEEMAEPTEEMAEPTEEMAEPTEEMAEPTEEMMDLSGQTVTFWHVWGAGSAAEGMQKIIDDFNASNEWGITVVGVDQGRQGDLETAVNAGIASGDLPNISPGFPNSVATWYNAGAIAPLNDFISDPVYGLTADQAAAIYPANFASGTLADGTQVALPIHQSENVIFYNNTWAQELGFDAPPANAQEFMDQACAAAAFNASDDNPDNDGTGGLVLFPGASNVASFLFAFNGSFLTEDGTGYTMNTDELLQVALYLKEMQDNGCTFATDSFPNPEFANRLALFTMSSTAGIPFQQAAMDDAGSTDEWSLIPFVGPDGTKAVNAFGQMIGIFDQGPEANMAAWLWLKHFTSPEIQAEWITFSAYFPSQTTTEQFMGDYIAANPIYATGLELGQYGQSEPNLASWGAVRGAVQDAFFAILGAESADEIAGILADLDVTAAELLAESQ